MYAQFIVVFLLFAVSIIIATYILLYTRRCVYLYCKNVYLYATLNSISVPILMKSTEVQTLGVNIGCADYDI